MRTPAAARGLEYDFSERWDTLDNFMRLEMGEFRA